MDLTAPEFTQPDVLKVTRVKPPVLQTWINRKAIELAVQNPGTGKSRLYSGIDILKIGIMRRLSDLRVDLSVSKQIAEAAAAIVAGPRFDDTAASLLKWDCYLFMRPDDASQKAVDLEIAARSPLQVLDRFGLADGIDPEAYRLTQLAWPWDGTGIRRASGDDKYGTIDDAERARFAAQGIHAEPVIIFPLGEIVRGTLLQVEALAEPAKE
ncbi:hypothetical protein EN794_043840 [Mesorhizobium sp. M00.F.Ca.ET.151.01.1.1]|nr:hypothetical protein EN794_043840 [Mesorhizobium sp. M00.F.Ca.ET.151.01.1.1]